MSIKLFSMLQQNKQHHQTKTLLTIKAAAHAPTQTINGGKVKKNERYPTFSLFTKPIDGNPRKNVCKNQSGAVSLCPAFRATLKAYTPSSTWIR